MRAMRIMTLFFYVNLLSFQIDNLLKFQHLPLGKMLALLRLDMLEIIGSRRIKTVIIVKIVPTITPTPNEAACE